jgi:uncharacterized protein (TIGR03067 family)
MRPKKSDFLRGYLMRISFVLLCGFASLLPAQTAKDDVAKLKGTWSVVALDTPTGGKVPDDVLKAIKITFTDNKMIFKSGGETREMVYKVDPSQKPATMDVIRKQDGKEETARGIYLLEGDTLKFCASEPGFDRPKEFKPEAASKTGVMTLKKDKE